MALSSVAPAFAIETIGTGGQVGAPAVATLSDGRFVVVWAEVTGAPAGEFLDTDGAIFARIYNADGKPAATAVQINPWQPGAQFSPSVAATIDGGFAVAWINTASFGDSAVDTDAFLAQFDANGAILETGAAFPFEDLVPDAPPIGLPDDATTALSRIEPLGDGFAAVYRAGYAVEIRSGDGGLIGALSFGADSVDTITSVTRLQGGNCLVGVLTAQNRTFFQLTDGSLGGAPLGIPGLSGPVKFTVAPGTFPDGLTVTALVPGTSAPNETPFGGFAITMLRAINGTGSAEIVVNTYTAWATQTGSFTIRPGIAVADVLAGGFDTLALPDGTLVIAWTGSDDDGFGLRVQHLDADGSALGAAQVVNTTQGGDQTAPHLALLADGSVVLTYLDGAAAVIDGRPAPLQAVILTFDSDSTPGRPSKGNDLIEGTGAGDSFGGLAGNDTIRGNAGDDALFGGLGNDSLVGGIGNDGLRGGAGADRMLGEIGDDGLAGQAGNDRLGGGDGNDGLAGGAGLDILYGGTGDDWLDGGAGDDTLSGGIGADTFILRQGGGGDLVLDFTAADDTLQLDRALWAAAGPLTRAQVITRFAATDGADLVFTFAGGQVIRLEDVAALTIADLVLI